MVANKPEAVHPFAYFANTFAPSAVKPVSLNRKGAGDGAKDAEGNYCSLDSPEGSVLNSSGQID
jgi:hypothetical protein